MRNPYGIGSALALALTLSLGGAAQAGRRTEPALARSVEVAGQPLVLTGQAVQRKLIFDVYAIGLYLDEPVATPEQVVASDQVKRVHLRMLRDARRDQVANAFREGFLAGNGSRCEALKAPLNRLLAAIPDVKKGQELNLTYVPGEGVTLEAGASRLRIPGKAFADALLRVWLGADPGTRKLARQLVGQG